MLKNKKIMWIGIIIILIIIIITLIFFTKFNNNTSKNFKIGNNTTSQEIVDNILNMSSYKATIAVDVKSNKNESKYVLKQSYSGEEDNWQEVIEPSNIAGVKVTKSGKSLKIENANLNLSSIFENYEFISDNCLDLNSFIESDEFDYFIDTLSKCKYAYFLKDQGLIFNEAAKEEVGSTITDEQRRLSLEGKMILVEPSNYFDILMSTLQGITRNIAQEISED